MRAVDQKLIIDLVWPYASLHERGFLYKHAPHQHSHTQSVKTPFQLTQLCLRGN